MKRNTRELIGDGGKSSGRRLDVPGRGGGRVTVRLYMQEPYDGDGPSDASGAALVEERLAVVPGGVAVGNRHQDGSEVPSIG